MGDPSRLVVVFNPAAGRRRAHTALAALTSRFEGRISAVIETTQSSAFAEHVRAATSAAQAQGARVTLVAVGGDGTLSMALNALASVADATLAVLPAGSGNDFADALGIRSVAEALAALDADIARDVDCGTVNGRRFANCVGIGLDAEVGALSARLRGRGYPPGPSYYAAAIAGLFMIKPIGVTVEAASGTTRYERGVMVTIGNGHSYGGGFRGAPFALLDDGLLDVYVFSDIEGFFARFGLMQRIRSGSHDGARNVASLRVAALDVTFDRDVAMHVDGELATVRHAAIGVIPAGMRVIAPAAAR